MRHTYLLRAILAGEHDTLVVFRPVEEKEQQGRSGAHVAGDTVVEEESVPALVGQRRRSWARLLRRIYEVDPLSCPRRGDALKIVSVFPDPVLHGGR